MIVPGSTKASLPKNPRFTEPPVIVMPLPDGSKPVETVPGLSAVPLDHAQRPIALSPAKAPKPSPAHPEARAKCPVCSTPLAGNVHGGDVYCPVGHYRGVIATQQSEAGQ